MCSAVESLATQQIPAAGIGSGERIAVDAIAGFEVAFEVCAPSGIGGIHVLGRLARMTERRLPAHFLDKPVALQDVGDGAARRKLQAMDSCQ